jgi:outer membrane lipoprotein SlyB
MTKKKVIPKLTDWQIECRAKRSQSVDAPTQDQQAQQMDSVQFGLVTDYRPAVDEMRARMAAMFGPLGEPAPKGWTV